MGHAGIEPTFAIAKAHVQRFIMLVSRGDVFAKTDAPEAGQEAAGKFERIALTRADLDRAHYSPNC